MRTVASLRAWQRALPTLLRIGVAETLAYRIEFVIWMLTNSLPLIMLGLWVSVAQEAPFGRFGSDEFIAYYLAALIVRNMTGSWVVWQVNEDIRSGRLSIRLLRPLHPFVTYATTHIASVPLRGLIAIPFAGVLLVTASADAVSHDPVAYVIFAVSLAGAWLLTFCMLMLIGSLGLFIEKSLAVHNAYLGLFAVASGYLIPLELFPDWAQRIANTLPFRYMLAFPVETVTGVLPRGEAARQLAIQWGFAGLAVVAALLTWRAGIRRYEAYGS